MAESLPSPKGVAKAAPVAAISALHDVARTAAALRDSYAEHLNHHCPACTKAWAELSAALEALPPR